MSGACYVSSPSPHFLGSSASVACRWPWTGGIAVQAREFAAGSAHQAPPACWPRAPRQRVPSVGAAEPTLPGAGGANPRVPGCLTARWGVGPEPGPGWPGTSVAARSCPAGLWAAATLGRRRHRPRRLARSCLRDAGSHAPLPREEPSAGTCRSSLAANLARRSCAATAQSQKQAALTLDTRAPTLGPSAPATCAGQGAPCARAPTDRVPEQEHGRGAEPSLRVCFIDFGPR